ncbi:hypothetical protein STEG23_003405, partial [Scotinomys teguina]
YPEAGHRKTAWDELQSTSIAPRSAGMSLFIGTKPKMNRQTLVHLHQGALALWDASGGQSASSSTEHSGTRFIIVLNQFTLELIQMFLKPVNWKEVGISEIFSDLNLSKILGNWNFILTGHCGNLVCGLMFPVGWSDAVFSYSSISRSDDITRTHVAPVTNYG